MSARVLRGDCRKVLASLDAESIDAIVTDPPYGIRFMGERWDYEIPSVDAFAEMYRVLKPGGRLLCFAATRTMHRMWVNVEDAGFTIEDSIAWMFGTGFPKHQSKLKPAYEPVCVARKGAPSLLNINDCRIPAEKLTGWRGRPTKGYGGLHGVEVGGRPVSGRWPANVVLDEEAATVLDSDTNDASRFFYVAKASQSERGESNGHPTVKPVALMRHLVRLVTPEGGTVLDPFTGSGTTGVAAVLEGRSFLGIELDKQYARIARARIGHAKKQRKPARKRRAA